ncbi:MAG TPA: 16S rRNA processing protein RimM, partial [Desulfobulbaceae bacterium]|nr:16S rRNA processing protein RimM [Desulfobulbaceae bacterium]
KKDDFILLGKVSKAHGIRGEVKIYPYSGHPEQFAAVYRRLYLAMDKESPPVLYEVEHSRVQGKQVLIKLANCLDRTAAEQLAGFLVYAQSQDLPKLSKEEFYLHELEGKELMDTAGNVLGFSSHIITAGAQDLLLVRHGDKEYMVPIVRDFIVAIEKERVVLDLPPGLMEING